MANVPVNIHLLRLDLSPARVAELAGRLAAEESARAARYLMEDARRRFTAARGHAREVLGGYLGCRPEDVRFGELPNGKPFLLACASADPDGRMVKRHGVSFNLSHSADLCLLAVDPSGRRELGVDVEALRPDAAFLNLARRFFAPAEAEAIAALPEADRPQAFFRLWTRKEALLKLTGIGITGGLNRYPIPMGEERRARIGEWWLVDLDPGEGFVAALAAEGDAPEIRWL